MTRTSFSAASIVTALLSLAVLAALAQDIPADEGRISGIVRDSFNSLFPGVKVSVIDTAKDFRRETTTTASGAYALANLPRGTYVVSAGLPGFQTVIHIQTVEGRPVDLNFFLSPTGIRHGAVEPAGPNITGTVRDFDYVSLAGVQLTFVGRAPGRVAQVMTDDRGSYSLSDLPPAGTFEVVAEKAGFESLRLKDIPLANSITTQLHLKLRRTTPSR